MSQPVTSEGFLGGVGHGEEFFGGWLVFLLFFHYFLLANVGVCFWETSSPDDEKHWRAGGKPENGSPAFGRVWNNGSVENDRQKVPQGVTFLENTRQDTSAVDGDVIQRGGQRETKYTAHCYSKKSTDSQKLLKRFHKTSANLQHNQKTQVDNVGPFTAVSVTPETENQRTHGTQHEHQSDAPGDVGDGFIEGFGDFVGVQRNSEKVKGIPGPACETHEEVVPVVPSHLLQWVERVEKLPLRVRTKLFSGREKRRYSGGKVLLDSPGSELRRLDYMFVVLLDVLQVHGGGDGGHGWGMENTAKSAEWLQLI